MTLTKLIKVLPGILAVSTFFLAGGCVQRKLTINTEPSGALVVLNDEEIGTSPVTVGFEWYGDYNIRISKPGFATLKTNRQIPRPVHDRFPFDLLYDVLGSNRIDAYNWSFELQPYQSPNREDLIKAALSMQKETVTELAKPLPKE